MKFDAYGGGGLPRRLPTSPIAGGPYHAGPTVVVEGEAGRARRLDHGVVDELGIRYQVVDAWHVTGYGAKGSRATHGDGQAQFFVAQDKDGLGCVLAVASVDVAMADQLREAGLPQRLAFTFVVFTGLPMAMGQCGWVCRQLARMATNGLLPVPVTWTDSDRLCWTLAAKVTGDIAEADQARKASG